MFAKDFKLERFFPKEKFEVSGIPTVHYYIERINNISLKPKLLKNKKRIDLQLPEKVTLAPGKNTEVPMNIGFRFTREIVGMLSLTKDVRRAHNLELDYEKSILTNKNSGKLICHIINHQDEPVHLEQGSFPISVYFMESHTSLPKHTLSPEKRDLQLKDKALEIDLQYANDSNTYITP